MRKKGMEFTLFQIVLLIIVVVIIIFLLLSTDLIKEIADAILNIEIGTFK